MLLLRIDLMHLQVASLDYQHPSNLRVRGLLLFAGVKAPRTHRSFESLVARGTSCDARNEHAFIRR
jgi:hypothetical protein